MEKYEKPALEVVNLELEESILNGSSYRMGVNYYDDVDYSDR